MMSICETRRFRAGSGDRLQAEVHALEVVEVGHETIFEHAARISRSAATLADAQPTACQIDGA